VGAGQRIGQEGGRPLLREGARTALQRGGPILELGVLGLQVVEVLLDAALGALQVVDHGALHDGRSRGHPDRQREEHGHEAVDVVPDVDHQPNPDRR
jgi:hypothetical protein